MSETKNLFTRENFLRLLSAAIIALLGWFGWTAYSEDTVTDVIENPIVVPEVPEPEIVSDTLVLDEEVVDTITVDTIK